MPAAPLSKEKLLERRARLESTALPLSTIPEDAHPPPPHDPASYGAMPTGEMGPAGDKAAHLGDATSGTSLGSYSFVAGAYSQAATGCESTAASGAVTLINGLEAEVIGTDGGEAAAAAQVSFGANGHGSGDSGRGGGGGSGGGGSGGGGGQYNSFGEAAAAPEPSPRVLPESAAVTKPTEGYASGGSMANGGGGGGGSGKGGRRGGGRGGGGGGRGGPLNESQRQHFCAGCATGACRRPLPLSKAHVPTGSTATASISAKTWSTDGSFAFTDGSYNPNLLRWG